MSGGINDYGVSDDIAALIAMQLNGISIEDFLGGDQDRPLFEEDSIWTSRQEPENPMKYCGRGAFAPKPQRGGADGDIEMGERAHRPLQEIDTGPVSEASGKPVKQCRGSTSASEPVAQKYTLLRTSSIINENFLQQEKNALAIGLNEVLSPYSAVVTLDVCKKFEAYRDACISFLKITDLLNPEKRKWSSEKTRIKEELIRDHLSKNSQFSKNLSGEYNVLKLLDEMVLKITRESLKKEKCALIAMYRPDVDPTALQDHDFAEMYAKCLEESKLASRLQTQIDSLIGFSNIMRDDCRNERVEYRKNQLSFLVKCLEFDVRKLTPLAKKQLFSLIQSGKLDIPLLSQKELESFRPLVYIPEWMECAIDFSQEKKLEEREQLSGDIGCPGIPFSELDEFTQKFYISLLETAKGTPIDFSRLDVCTKNQFVSLLKCSGVTGDQLNALSKEARAHFDQYGEINEISRSVGDQLSKLIYSVTLDDLRKHVSAEINCEDVVAIDAVVFEGERAPKYKISCSRFPAAYSIFLLLSDEKVAIKPVSSQYKGEKEFFLTKEQLNVLIKFLATTKETMARHHDVMVDILGSKDFLSLGTKTVAEVRNVEKKKLGENLRIALPVLDGLSRDTKTPILLYKACSLDLTNHPDRDLIKRMLKGAYRLAGLKAVNDRIKEFQRDKPYVSNLNVEELKEIEPSMNRIVVFINGCIRNLRVDTLTEGISLLLSDPDCKTILQAMQTYQVQKLRELLHSMNVAADKRGIITTMTKDMAKELCLHITFGDDLDQLLAPPGSDKRDRTLLGGISTYLIERLNAVFGVDQQTIEKLMGVLRNKGVKEGNGKDLLKRNFTILIDFLKENAKSGNTQLPLRSFPLFIEYVKDSHKYCTREHLLELVEEFRLDWLDEVSTQFSRIAVKEHSKAMFTSPAECYVPSEHDIKALYGTTQRCIRPNLTKPTITALFKTLKELPAVQDVVGRTPTIKIALDALEEAFYNRITSVHYLDERLSANVYYSKDLVHQGFEYIETLVAKIKYRDRSKVTNASIEEAFIELIAFCSDEDLVNSCAQGFSGRLQAMLLRLDQAVENDLKAVLYNFKKQCADGAFTKTLSAFGQDGQYENSMYLPLKNDLYMKFGIASASRTNTIRATSYHGDFFQKAEAEFLRQYSPQAVYKQAFAFFCNKFKACNAAASEDPEKDKEIYTLLQLLGFGDHKGLLDKVYRIHGSSEFRWQYALFENDLPSKLVPYLIKTQSLNTL